MHHQYASFASSRTVCLKVSLVENRHCLKNSEFRQNTEVYNSCRDGCGCTLAVRVQLCGVAVCYMVLKNN